MAKTRDFVGLYRLPLDCILLGLMLDDLTGLARRSRPQLRQTRPEICVQSAIPQAELDQATTRLALAEEAIEAAGATALAERDAFWRGELARTQAELAAARAALQVAAHCE